MGKRTDVVDFVKTWQASSSRQQVADGLGVTYGSIASREKTLRKAGVNLKEMPKQPRGIQIDANLLNSLIAQIDETPEAVLETVAETVTQE